MDYDDFSEVLAACQSSKKFPEVVLQNLGNTCFCKCNSAITDSLSKLSQMFDVT